MKPRLQKLILYGAPLSLACVNLTHPLILPPVYDSILHHGSWWIRLHTINLILFPLVGLSAYYLVKDVLNAAGSLSRIAIAIFVPLYAAFDAIIGIGTGILVRNASALPPGQLSTLRPYIDAFWNSGPAQGVAAAGSIAWVFAMLAAAVAFTVGERRTIAAIAAAAVFGIGSWAEMNLFLPSPGHIPTLWWLITAGTAVVLFVFCKPRLTPALLALAGSLFGASHVKPTGPLGMLCFVLAAALSKTQDVPASV
jgi:hypothetical protein